MKQRAHITGFAVLIALACAHICLAATASVTGVVRNSAGVPQMGAQVELLRADQSVAVTVITNSKGRFLISSILPGKYSVKAICQTYLPTLREDVRVHTGTVVNLTLSTLYEVIQWLPAQPRRTDARRDDWTWTLRSASNRPLLRMLEDGPLVVIDNGRGSARQLKARLVATGQEGTFGESGQRFSASVEETPAGSSELIARVDFTPGSDAGMESMLGFRQDLGVVGSVQSIAAVALHPEVEGPDGAGLNELSLSSWENIRMGDKMEITAGSSEIYGSLSGAGSTLAVLPYLDARYKSGNTSLRYRMTSYAAHQKMGDESVPSSLPPLVVRDGHLTLERGTHHELGWERRTDHSAVTVALFTDSLHNPVIDAEGSPVNGLLQSAATNVLVDPLSGMVRAVGPDFRGQGFEARIEHKLPHGSSGRLSYANGQALVIPALNRPVNVTQLLMAARAHHAQSVALSLEGTLEGTGTRWHASYRWQPEDTLTPVAPFSLEANSPYLNLHLRQQGYRSFMLTDGSLLLFAQDPRAIRAGVAFSF